MSAPELTWRDRLTAYVEQQVRPPHKYGHQPRLYALTQTLTAHSPGFVCNDDVLFAAAFLHDLGVFIGHRPEDPKLLKLWDHVAYACEKVSALLGDFGFPAAQIPAVLACIREHQPQDEPHSPEAIVLRDADILEQLGAIGILRAASKLGSDHRFLLFADARRSLEQALHTLPSQLRLSAARALAEPRIQALRAFLMALDGEAGAHLG